MIIEFLSLISDYAGKFIPIITTIILVLVLFTIFNVVTNKVRKALIKKAKTKKQISNVQIFSKILKYIVFTFIILVAILSYTGSLTGLGIGIGLFSAALGWALQKPITGIAAWIMIVTRRPFEIGDRIIVGNVKGDVTDITLTHIYLGEIGGLVGGEETSGRTIMIPNSIMFEKNIINYTTDDEYTLDQVVVTVTYESNLDKAMKIAIDSATKILKKYKEIEEGEPYIRTYFQASGINVYVRYNTPTKNIQEISSYITQEIFKATNKAKDVEIAYPHTEIIYKGQK
jgi:small-conductance mechanosensitive channel